MSCSLGQLSGIVIHQSYAKQQLEAQNKAEE